MKRPIQIIADLVRAGHADPQGVDRPRAFVARLSGVLEAQGHKALADDLFLLLHEYNAAPHAVQAELIERYVVPDEV